MRNKSKLFLAFCLLLFASKVSALECDENNYINSHNVEMTCNQLQNLKSLGFSDFEITYMNQEEFDLNKDLKGEVVAETTKYYRTTTFYPDNALLVSMPNFQPISISEEITKEEYELAEPHVEEGTRGLTNGVTSTEYKLMTPTIINLGSNYRYKNVVSWKKAPATYHYDIIGIGIEQTKVYGVSSSKYIHSIHTELSNNACYDEETYSGTWSLSATGYAVKFKLPSNSVLQGVFDQLVTTMYFTVEKTDNNTITVLNAYGNYRHATSSFPNTSFSFSINLGYISIGGSYSSYYDSISTAQATWTGLNW